MKGDYITLKGDILIQVTSEPCVVHKWEDVWRRYSDMQCIGVSWVQSCTVCGVSRTAKEVINNGPKAFGAGS